jgi:hypothetical protein
MSFKRSNDLATSLIRLSVFITPFTILIFDLDVIFPFITPKFSAFECLMIINCTLLIFFGKITSNLSTIKCDNRIFKAHILILIGFTVTTLFSYNSVISLWGTVERREGLIFYLLITCWWISIQISIGKYDWNILSFIFIFIGLFLFIIQLIQYTNNQYRPSSLLNNPTFLSSYYAFSVACAWSLWRKINHINSNQKLRSFVNYFPLIVRIIKLPIIKREFFVVNYLLTLCISIFLFGINLTGTRTAF